MSFGDVLFFVSMAALFPIVFYIGFYVGVNKTTEKLEARYRDEGLERKRQEDLFEA